MKDSLGDRIKRYETAYNAVMTPHSVVIIRVDGKGFHTFTKGCEKPFDQKIIDSMATATIECASKIGGFKLTYTQSDEATFMLTDFDNLNTQGWFNYEVNKIISITASMFTVYFNKVYGSTDAFFDARAFIVPVDDWQNVFIWRQRDWERNLIQMVTRANFTHTECSHRKIPELKSNLHYIGVDYDNFSDQHKYGTFVSSNLGKFYAKVNYDSLTEYVRFDNKKENKG